MVDNIYVAEIYTDFRPGSLMGEYQTEDLRDPGSNPGQGIYSANILILAGV